MAVGKPVNPAPTANDRFLMNIRIEELFTILLTGMSGKQH
jgi:hypothetical protein